MMPCCITLWSNGAPSSKLSSSTRWRNVTLHRCNMEWVQECIQIPFLFKEMWWFRKYLINSTEWLCSHTAFVLVVFTVFFWLSNIIRTFEKMTKWNKKIYMLYLYICNKKLKADAWMDGYTQKTQTELLEWNIIKR